LNLQVFLRKLRERRWELVAVILGLDQFGFCSNMKSSENSTTFLALLRAQRRLWSRDQIEQHQLQCLNSLLATVFPDNTFYRNAFGETAPTIRSLAEWREYPTVSKADLVDPDDPMGLARNHTWPLDRYQRLHRTSGTSGRPLVMLDTHSDWQSWIETWQYVLDAAEVTSTDRVFMAFSFGPFIGFWTAQDACLARNAMVVPGGGLSTLARLDFLISTQSTVVCCTPSYALHMAEAAKQHGLDLVNSSVRRLIVAGEAGGSVPEIRHAIERAWGAQLTDHAGATEVGPWGFGTTDGQGMHVIETDFIAEFLPPTSPEHAAYASEHGLAELVLTSLYRQGAPVLRYRTGDLVRPNFDHDDDCHFVRLDGGVVGRADDMVVVRGVNIFPNAIGALLRSIPEVIEFRTTIVKQNNLDNVLVEVEDSMHQPQRVATLLQNRLGLRIDVVDVPIGTLPRFEGKGRRFEDRRKKR
jgi:phenylacetate-CoA ligase